MDQPLPTPRALQKRSSTLIEGIKEKTDNESIEFFSRIPTACLSLMQTDLLMEEDGTPKNRYFFNDLETNISYEVKERKSYKSYNNYATYLHLLVPQSCNSQPTKLICWLCFAYKKVEVYKNNKNIGNGASISSFIFPKGAGGSSSLQHFRKFHPTLVDLWSRTKAREEDRLVLKLSTKFGDNLQKNYLDLWNRSENQQVDKETDATLELILVGHVVKSLRPLVSVEDSSMYELYAFGASSKKFYKSLPSRTTITRRVDVAATEGRNILKEELQNIHCFSITSDLWTSRSTHSFISLTMHYLDNNFNMVNRYLDVAPFDETHTAVNIKEKLDKIFSEFGLSWSKCISATTDGAANIQKAFEGHDKEQLPFYGNIKCFAHKLHLVASTITSSEPLLKVQKRIDKLTEEDFELFAIDETIDPEVARQHHEQQRALLEDFSAEHITAFLTSLSNTGPNNEKKYNKDTVLKAFDWLKKTLNNIRRLVGHFKMSSLSTTMLQDAAKAKNKKYCSLKQDQKTRWNSTYTMICSVLQNKEALESVHDAFKSNRKRFKFTFPTKNEIAILEGIREIFKDFEKVTTLLSTETYSTNENVEIYTELLAKRLTLHRKDILASLEEENIGDTFNNFDCITGYLSYLLTIRFSATLNPCVKYAKCLSIERISYANKKMSENELDMNEMFDSFEKVYNWCIRSNSVPLEEQEADAEPNASTKRQRSGSVDSFFASLNELVAQPETTATSTRENTLNAIKAEYLSFSALQKKKDDKTLEFWNSKQGQKFPHLNVIASCILCSTATSVPSERVFSIAGLVLTARRASLSPLHLRNILFLNDVSKNKGLDLSLLGVKIGTKRKRKQVQQYNFDLVTKKLNFN